MKTLQKYNYRGFNLESITWGYREIFKNAIDSLHDENLLGEENQESTETFFKLLKHNGGKAQSCFDHVLKNFLVCLNSQNSWILKIPALFSDWTSLGTEFANHKIYMGLNYFEIWGKGGFGAKPDDVSYVINKARFLKNIDFDFAYNFIFSYKKLSKFLPNAEIDVFVEHALKLFQRHPENSYTFLRLKTKTSNLYVKMISKEARLSDINERLTLYASAISGYDLELSNMGELDADDLIERGSSVVSLDQWLYLPATVSQFPKREENLKYYMLLCAISSSALHFKSFNTIHGAQNASTCLEYIKNKGFKNPQIINNCFFVFETYRVLKQMCELFPGIRKFLKKAICEEIMNFAIPSHINEIMLAALRKLSGKKLKDNTELRYFFHAMEEKLDHSKSFIDTLNQIAEFAESTANLQLLKKYFSHDNRPLSFFPDYMFPGQISTAPDSMLAVDLKDENKDNSDDSETGEKENPVTDSDEATNENSAEDEAKDQDGMTVGFLYDEWNQIENDYFENWCCLREKNIPSPENLPLSKEYLHLTRHVKKIFEKLKPEQSKKEKYLQEGDDINIDLLTDYLTARKAKILDREKFYEKPFINKRDLTVAVVIDMSGSTGESVDKAKKIIDLEKESAYILGEGLAEIGDKFGIFGFSGNGRENAEFFIFKDFEEKWGEEVRKALFSASPRSSTRIGVAIRHTGYKLSKHHSKQKLIILITDGKPMDSNYDHNNRYAQYDVRKANEENYSMGIDSFCISTEENKIEDLEIMFPFHRYVIIKSMIELPKVLSQFYLKITK